MKQNTLSPVVQLAGVDTPDQNKAFRRQVQSYAEFLEKKLKEIPAGVGIDPVLFLADLEHEIKARFALRCVFLDYWCTFPDLVPANHARRLMTGVARFIWLMGSDYHPDQKEMYIEGTKWFDRIHSEILPLLSVYRGDEKPQLRSNDYVGWHFLIHDKEKTSITLQIEKVRELASLKIPYLAKGSLENKIRLNQSQKSAYQKLEEFYLLKSKGETLAGYDFRPIPLMVGLSGVGKTSVVSHFSKENNLPMLSLNCGGWLVTGAKAEPITLTVIQEFVRDNERGVLFIDELDKFGGTTDWYRSIQQEIYSLLDGRMESFPEWHPELVHKFKENFFLIGAGTWQASQKAATKLLGFKTQSDPSVVQSVLETQDLIPEELLFRFNADVIHIQPMSLHEFEERIRTIHQESKTPLPSGETYQSLAEKAVRSGKQNRWLEAYVSQIMRRKLCVSSSEPVCS